MFRPMRTYSWVIDGMIDQPQLWMKMQEDCDSRTSNRGLCTMKIHNDSQAFCNCCRSEAVPWMDVHPAIAQSYQIMWLFRMIWQHIVSEWVAEFVKTVSSNHIMTYSRSACCKTSTLPNRGIFDVSGLDLSAETVRLLQLHLNFHLDIPTSRRYIRQWCWNSLWGTLWCSQMHISVMDCRLHLLYWHIRIGMTVSFRRFGKREKQMASLTSLQSKCGGWPFDFITSCTKENESITTQINQRPILS